MAESIEVRAYGSLSKSLDKGYIQFQVQERSLEMPVYEVLNRLGIPVDKVQLVMLNHCSALLDTVVKQGDRVAVFPKEYPIFPDWKDYRYP